MPSSDRLTDLEGSSSSFSGDQYVDTAGDTLTGPLTIASYSTAQRDAIASPASGTVIYNTTTSKLNIFNGSTWGNSGIGDVTGAASSTDNEVPRFDGATGKIIQASGAPVTITDDGLMTVPDLEVESVATLGAVKANEIFEQDSGSGVTVDGVLIKDGLVDGTDVSLAYTVGGNTIPISDGGTDANDAEGARTNLGLVSGGSGNIWVEKINETKTTAGAPYTNTGYVQMKIGATTFNVMVT